MHSTEYDKKDELQKLVIAKQWKLHVTRTAYLLIDMHGETIAHYESADLPDYWKASTHYVDIFNSANLWDEQEFYHELCALADCLPPGMLPTPPLEKMGNQQSIQCLAAQRVEYKTIYIDVTTNFDMSELIEDDMEALGAFEARVPAHLDPITSAGAALGAYHNTIPIKHLDCFDFSVYDETGMALTPDYDADWYDLADTHRACLN
jgi:hypothetical protein